MRFNDDLNVWQCANKRFLQTIASSYIISNKVLNCSLVIGVFLIFFYDGMICNLGKIISLTALIIAVHRRANYIGFYDGYEQGYNDTVENPNNLHSFTDTQSELYWQEMEAAGFKKHVALFGLNRN